MGKEAVSPTVLGAGASESMDAWEVFLVRTNGGKALGRTGFTLRKTIDRARLPDTRHIKARMCLSQGRNSTESISLLSWRQR